MVRTAEPAVEEVGDLGAGGGLAELGEDAFEAVPTGEGAAMAVGVGAAGARPVTLTSMTGRSCSRNALARAAAFGTTCATEPETIPFCRSITPKAAETANEDQSVVDRAGDEIGEEPAPG